MKLSIFLTFTTLVALTTAKAAGPPPSYSSSSATQPTTTSSSSSAASTTLSPNDYSERLREEAERKFPHDFWDQNTYMNMVSDNEQLSKRQNVERATRCIWQPCKDKSDCASGCSGCNKHGACVD